MAQALSPYRGFRCPAEVILAARGVVVSSEGIRERGLCFGRPFANEPKRRRPRPGDKWHMDEVFIRAGGKQHHLWRVVGQDGHVFDIPVQSRRNEGGQAVLPQAAPRPAVCTRVIATDKLKSDAAAKRTVPPHVERRQSKCLNNRAEVSLPSTRRRERQVQRFKPARHAQRFLPTHARIHNHVQLRRHRLAADEHRAARANAFRIWAHSQQS